MKKLLALLTLSVAVTSVSLSARADEFQFDYLMLEADLEDVNEFEPDALQLKYISPISENADFVIAFALGISDDDISVSDPFFGNASLSVELDTLLGAYARARADLGTSGQIFAQVGLVRLEYELDAEIFNFSGSDSYDEFGVAFGFGASFDLGDRAAFVIEYNLYPDVDVEDIADIETTALSLGFRTSF